MSVEDDAEYKQRKEFSEVNRDLTKLINKAHAVELEERQNTNFSAAEIEEQFRIQKKLQQKQLEAERPVKDSPQKPPSKEPFLVYWCDGAEAETINCKVMRYKVQADAQIKFEDLKKELMSNKRLATGVLISQGVS